MVAKIWHRQVYLWDRIMDRENRLVTTKGEGVGGGMEWEFGISRCKHIYIYRIDKQQGHSI